MFYNIIVGPIEVLVGWIFKFIINRIPSVGVIGAIIGVSVAINILALPLYNIAESIQEKERQINKKLEPRVKRIKKGFKGDEQFMMLSEYYRQNSYHPLYALRGSLSILIEIPFFIAAYSYLSSSSILKESSFWIFSNLGEADKLFSIKLGTLVIPINVLPIIMTGINFISGYIYTRGATKRDKIQLYLMGLFFLVLLYNSPSGLVIYWICNNIFSLVKTIVLKTKNPGKILHIVVSIGIVAIIYKLRIQDKRKLLPIIAISIVFICYPLILKLIKQTKFRLNIPPPRPSRRNYLSIVLLSGLSLALLCGFLLPASAIASSPEEFSYIGNVDNPVSFVWPALWLYLGLFLFWPLVIYKMFGEKTRKIEAFTLFSLLVVALFDAFVFTGDYGTITPEFALVNASELSSPITNLGPFIVLFVAFLMFLVLDYYGKSGIIALLSLSIIISEIVMGTVKITTIEKRFKEYKILKEKGEEYHNAKDNVYTLSRNGKNVVVIFLDRAINTFLPYAMEQLDGLKEQFDGFTYYPNTVSYGNTTTLGSPSMMGGYEYTPEKINARENELLKDKHNEAATLAPILFSNAGYSVTVTDSPLPNYSMRKDLSAFSGLENVHAEEIYDKFLNEYISTFNIYNLTAEETEELTRDGAVNFSMIQILPEVLRWTFWYYCIDSSTLPNEALGWLASLYFLDEETTIKEDGNTYTFIGNELTHNIILLNEELLIPATENDAFNATFPNASKTALNLYSVFCAALKQIGQWLDWMKENNVYDNTRIIIVSDHGFPIDVGTTKSAQVQYMPLLMVKDFNSRGELKTDETFMTNADTILISTEGLEEINLVNPYTGNKITQEKDNGVNAYPVYSNTEWNAPHLVKWTQFTLVKENAVHVEENALDSSNWIPLLKWEEMNK